MSPKQPDREFRCSWRDAVIICSALAFICAAPASAQTTFAEVNGQTPPEKIAALVWDVVFTKCGRSYYYARDLIVVNRSRTGLAKSRVVVEYRDPRPPMLKADNLSPATIANGTEYSGSTSISATMWRWRFDGDYWSKFQDGGMFYVTIKKENGKWQISEPNDADIGRKSDPGPGSPALLFDATAYTRGKVSCEAAAAAEPPKAEYGYVCPGTVLDANGIHPIKVTEPMKVYIKARAGETSVITVDDGQGDPANYPMHRVLNLEIRSSLPCGAHPNQ